MAKTNNNALTYNWSGKLGGVVFRRLRNGKTIVCKAPVSASNWAPTPRQERNRDKFAAANAYSLKAMNDPELRSFYSTFLRKKSLLTIQTIAVRDFSKPPTVDDIDISEYQKQTTILISADDDTKVVGVVVSVIDTNGLVVTTGQAQLRDRGDWEFNAGELPPIPGGYRVEAIASDKAGNTGTLSTMYEPK